MAKFWLVFQVAYAITRCHNIIVQKNDHLLMWQSGIVVSRNNAYAIVTKDPRQVKIVAHGQDGEDFLNELHNILCDLLKEHDLSWKENVKTNAGYLSTETARQMHEDGVEHHAGEPVVQIVKKYCILDSIISIKKPEINAVGLGAIAKVKTRL